MSKKNRGQKNEAAPVTEAQAKNVAPETKTEETKAPKEKKKREPKEKVIKVMYPGLQMGPDGEATVKLKEWPTDYDPAVHLRLKRSNFENEIPFLEQRVVRLQKKIDEINKEITAIKAGGSPTEAKKIKKFTKMADKFGELFNELRTELSEEQLAEYMKMFQDAAAGKIPTDAKG